MKYNPNEYTIEEKLKILHDSGWYEYYGSDNWRNSNMSEMGGTSFESAFKSCLKDMIFDEGIEEELYFKNCYEKYLNE